MAHTFFGAVLPAARYPTWAAAWVGKNDVSCVEAIYQTDRVREELPDLAEKVCKVVP